MSPVISENWHRHPVKKNHSNGRQPRPAGTPLSQHQFCVVCAGPWCASSVPTGLCALGLCSAHTHEQGTGEKVHTGQVKGGVSKGGSNGKRMVCAHVTSQLSPSKSQQDPPSCQHNRLNEGLTIWSPTGTYTLVQYMVGGGCSRTKPCDLWSHASPKSCW